LDNNEFPNEQVHEPVTHQEEETPYKPPCFTYQRIEVPSKETEKEKTTIH